ncbi:bestrophin family protein [Acidiphilium sp. C61]|jgi:putative membrane protein|uniref:bestrophin family protein n=1 Tax=Acidiphilium sp. C61 TaxID=1671485 RepID=UPI00157ADCC8|nr:bestrophin family protein [Acidiphilium sp. C61]
MIVHDRANTLTLLTTLRGSILQRVAPRLLALFLLALAVTIAHAIHPLPDWPLATVPFTLLGLGLSIFLGFRNSACYDRWWEGRRQWGTLIAESRALIREITALLPDDAALTQRLGGRIAAFAHLLRDHLRGAAGADWQDWLAPAERAWLAGQRNRPDAALRLLSAELAGLVAAGRLSDMLYRILAERIAAMTGIQAACERLRTTPTPFTYSLLLHRTAWLFCIFLPFGFVQTLGLATPIVTVILGYAFFGLDALGDELEEPFAISQNALPLNAFARTIEIAVLEALGADELPPPLLPVNHVLS